MQNLKRFLNTVCPYTILDSEYTWGEYIATYAKGILGVFVFYAVYLLLIVSAESIGVID